MASLAVPPALAGLGVSPRKVLVPLAVVAALAGLGAVSGLPLSGSGDSGAGVSLVAEDGRTATLTVTDLAPGDSVTRSVTITSSADAPTRVTLTESGDPATYGRGALALTISAGGREVYDGTFGGLADYPLDVGRLEAGASATYTFVVSLPSGAPSVRGGTAPVTAPATASYSWAMQD